MTDHTELKRLAEAAPEGPWFGPEYAPGTSYVFDVDLGTLLHYESIDTEQDACLRYVAAANPAAVLALIAEIVALKQEVRELHSKVGGSATRPDKGHGHVFPRADGIRMRCGGPGMCKECSADLLRKEPSNGR